ncbi:hypothetical protein L226DRAFT_612414 [Lentinus tigrinus ALCF2SS1-7]|uniref:RING-type domain-containing protein n=1 Tax=Lentinus tigrinus ALCF2SS1-6 TaxID=1328759 RepID=A0A5C2SE58_9APHY|nr:hypothetical protein L227DRAFT_574049 [Lentinus tigrinus ALCF2SS1-6]RPD76198.1 hypothetical protein L226DRAFT_612414 [Lentinus tigrinus ALCF2SS1-7]
MSSPAGTLGPAPTANATVNTRKRVLTDSEDTEERDSKRVRSQDDQIELGKRKDTKGKDKEKKKKRKKRRKVPVIQANSSDAETPAPVHNAKSSRVRSRSILSAGPSTNNTAPQMKVEEPEARPPSAGPSRVAAAPQPKDESIGITVPQGSMEDKDRATEDNAVAYASAAPVARAPSVPIVKDEASNTTILSCAVKGKARATSADAETSSTQVQITELQGQISVKNKLVTDHEGLVSTLQQSLSCQICLDLMHRPFALSPCGHSACHQCLVNWFKAPPADVPANQVLPVWLRKKTCPHCRAVVKDRPIEIWAIKEMVANLVKSGLAQGFYSPAEEAANDAINVDPWTGIFRPERGDGPYAHGAPVAHLMGQHDDEDGVYRCIDCFHEIMDGVCSDCGRVYPGHDPDLEFGSDYDDDDSVHDPWRDEAQAVWAGDNQLAFFDIMPHPFFPLQHLNPFQDDDSVDWDAGGDTEIESDGEAAQGNWRRRLPEVAHIDELDNEEGADEDGYESSFIDDGDAGPVRRNSGSPARGDREATIELSDDEDEDEVQFIGRRRGPARGRGPIIIESDEEEDVDVGGGGAGHDFGHGSDEEHNHRLMSDREHTEYGSDEEDLAGEVAAREYALYGDDGSVPRRDYAAHPYGDEFVDDDDGMSYRGSEYSDEEDLAHPYAY